MDGYDLFCSMKLAESDASAEKQEDDITCACAEYLHVEGYHTPQHLTLSKHALQEAAQLIPTTRNMIKGESS